MRKIRVLDNVYDLITINMEDRFKDNVAFRFYDTANDAVTTTLYKDYVQDIRKAVNYFQSTIPEIKGKKICLLTKNSYEYAVNTATFVGQKQAGILGGIAATLGIVFPSLVIITALAGVINSFSHLAWVQHAFAGIRVCVCVLIFNAVVKLLKGSVKDWPAALIFAAVLAAALLTDLSPVVFVAAAAALGIVIQNVIRRAK